jgi:hypothetical protein
MRKVTVQLQDRGTGREELKERHSLTLDTEDDEERM